MRDSSGSKVSNITFLKGIVFSKKACKLLQAPSNFGVFVLVNSIKHYEHLKILRNAFKNASFIYFSRFLKNRVVKKCPAFKQIPAGSSFYHVATLEEFLRIDFIRLNKFFSSIFYTFHVKCFHLHFSFDFYKESVALPLKTIAKNPGLVVILPLKIWVSIVRQIQYVLFKR